MSAHTTAIALRRLPNTLATLNPWFDELPSSNANQILNPWKIPCVYRATSISFFRTLARRDANEHHRETTIHHRTSPVCGERNRHHPYASTHISSYLLRADTLASTTRLSFTTAGDNRWRGLLSRRYCCGYRAGLRRQYPPSSPCIYGVHTIELSTYISIRGSEPL